MQCGLPRWQGKVREFGGLLHTETSCLKRPLRHHFQHFPAQQPIPKFGNNDNYFPCSPAPRILTAGLPLAFLQAPLDSAYEVSVPCEG